MAQLAARRSHNPKVASSILAGSIVFFFFFEKIKNKNKNKKTSKMIGEGFEPSPPKRLVP